LVVSFVLDSVHGENVMRANAKWFGLGLLSAGVLACSMAAAQVQTPPPEIGRYSIVFWSERAVVLDTTDGRTWSHMYEASDRGFSAAEFERVKEGLIRKPKK
jgi:hypothetical protein